MEFENDYLLLIAIGLPMASIVLMNVLLAASGEKGTLLLPTLEKLPTAQREEDADAENCDDTLTVPPEAVCAIRRRWGTASFRNVDASGLPFPSKRKETA